MSLIRRDHLQNRGYSFFHFVVVLCERERGKRTKASERSAKCHLRRGRLKDLRSEPFLPGTPPRRARLERRERQNAGREVPKMREISLDQAGRETQQIQLSVLTTTLPDLLLFLGLAEGLAFAFLKALGGGVAG